MEVFETKSGYGWENMGDDLCLLEENPEKAIRLRHYEWRGLCATFGYSQRLAEVQARVEGDYELYRRPTGGGIVDHKEDWTYSLIIPAGHSLHRERAIEVYRVVHKCLRDALNMKGLNVRLAPCPKTCGSATCFDQPEIHDLIDNQGVKIAGAAQNRTKNGMLIQGSVKFKGDLLECFTESIAGRLEDGRIRSRNWEGIENEECYEKMRSEAWNWKR